MSEMNFDQVLDCKGMNCPLPVIKTKKAIDTMDSGQVLKMIATDPGSKNDISAWASRTGHELLINEQTDEGYVFFIKKK
ncbi:MAG: sulfurtransferase TusA family protein [FCB group bacterium]|nr:sulfurtransferase TusA family protein [FCB group bacterium]MBL7028899.1 sulfurtransferase TusA family protein [Candidatus Neomarinimicrobiota bacterium]MBL7122737.1 sulfurtransferase TusA family protein [Candidatus Neomarinimicrobiota bacterium]